MIKRMVICSPFTEPNKHWQNMDNDKYEQMPGRREAGYVRMNAGSKKRLQNMTFQKLKQVNDIRLKVDKWRNGQNGSMRYDNTTLATRRLLEHWTCNENQKNRDLKFFWCQIEAIETIIWLAEVATNSDRKKLCLGDGGEFERWCSKMATGTGKTVVMGMLIAWQTINHWTNPNDLRFTNKFLVVAPNLTIYERLQTLRDTIYDEFDIIPNFYRRVLTDMTISICNWHKFDVRDYTGTKKIYAKKGRESPQSFTSRILGFSDNGRILVINDESHHAWREGIGNEDAKWMQGLDQIHKVHGILRCHDFSATPFRPNPKFKVFEWIISDFGFMDAIESGLIKTPGIGGVIDPKSGIVPFSDKPNTESVYRICEQDLNKKKIGNQLNELPDQIRKEYARLAVEWNKQHTDWKKYSNSKISWSAPPVFITICNNTYTAERVFAELKNNKFGTNVYDPKTALHIDSNAIKALNMIEQIDKSIAITGETTEKQLAESLRQKVNTVGKRGKPGALINNITSVNMLSEGWDAKNVRQILGLRAFDSQLLCEQVIGRGLRRMSYETDENGMFPEERVTVIGVPFQIMPQEDISTTPEPPSPLIEIMPYDDRAQYAIEWPNVVDGITKRTTKIMRSIVWDNEKPLRISDDVLGTEIFNVDIDQKKIIDKAGNLPFDGNYDDVRMQSIIFEAAKRIHSAEPDLFEGENHVLFPHIVSLIKEALKHNIIQLKPQNDNEQKRLLICNMGLIVRHIWRIIVNNNNIYDQSNLELDPYQQTRSTHDIRPRYVPEYKVVKTKKTHTNMSTFDSSWEKRAALEMDNNLNVKAYIRNNSAMGFTIDYRDVDGTIRQYFPDFLVSLVNKTQLILEIKGYEDERNEIKGTFAKRWADAVSSDGRFGKWVWHEIHANDEDEIAWMLHECINENMITV